MKPSEREWMDEIIHSIAKEHRVILNDNDPILASALIHKKVIESFYKEHRKIQVDFKKLLIQHDQSLMQQMNTRLDQHNKTLEDMTDSLVCSLDDVVKQQETTEKPINKINTSNASTSIIQQSPKLMMLLALLFGMFSGVVIERFLV